jgi:hypothetical protein
MLIGTYLTLRISLFKHDVGLTSNIVSNIDTKIYTAHPTGRKCKIKGQYKNTVWNVH